MDKILIGILGTADIAPRGIIEPAQKRDDMAIWAVGSRERSRAAVFAEKHQIPNSYGSYDALLQCDDISLIYISLISSLHAEWVVKAASAGKHVLVEKPVCMSRADFDRIRAAAGSNGVHVFEGLMAQHHPCQQKLRDIIDQEVYGKVRSIRTRACYRLEDSDDFRFYPEKGGGVFFEEGSLWCQMTQLCLGLEPETISGRSAFDGPNGIDTTFEARMDYGAAFSQLFCSYEQPYEANHWFDFEKATLKIRNFWKPTFGSFKIHLDIVYRDSGNKERITFSPSNYFENQLSYVADVINGKGKVISLDDALDRIGIMESIYLHAKGIAESDPHFKTQQWPETVHEIV